MTVTLKMDGLQSLLKALEKKSPVARIGILGSSQRRGGKGTTNATVGAAHEFGTSRIPQRSFLRVPLIDHLEDELAKSGAFTRSSLQEIASARSLIPWVKKLAIIGEGIVSDAFNTGGFGKWPPWAPSTSKGKARAFSKGKINTLQLLVETQQLRNSITSEVV